MGARHGPGEPDSGGDEEDLLTRESPESTSSREIRLCPSLRSSYRSLTCFRTYGSEQTHSYTLGWGQGGLYEHQASFLDCVVLLNCSAAWNTIRGLLRKSVVGPLVLCGVLTICSLGFTVRRETTSRWVDEEP